MCVCVYLIDILYIYSISIICMCSMILDGGYCSEEDCRQRRFWEWERYGGGAIVRVHGEREREREGERERDVCMYMCVCMRVRARACTRVCVCVYKWSVVSVE